MKVKREIQTIATMVTLTEKEVKTLLSAQEIVNNIWNELEDVDRLGCCTEKIRNAINEIDSYLSVIANLVTIEEEED